MESLYRKYRPQTFESMVGQKHIVSTLQNALTDGRMAHAYLFTGPRGTGKTTTARLLAKALMCEAGGGAATAHPDGTCEQCQEIARGTHPDVYELDAASRTGVDNVRDEIINRVAFAPTQGRYKVYVIDEVHMLTTAAFNALLKTLEEPPAHVVFVLCTTDPQKIPETVLSRCQRLEFHRISDADIAERLEFVCTSEGFEYDSGALALVARHARGGLRDALSTLETLSVHGRGTVRVEDARELLGEVADDTLSGMAELVAARDVAGCFARVDEMSSRGMDIEQYVRDFTRHMRNVYVAAVAGKGALRDAARPEEFVAQAAKFGGADRLAYILDLLGGLEDTLRTSTDQRLDFEVALARMARPKADLSLEALAARVEALEAELAAVKAGGVAVASVPVAATQPAAAPAGGAGRLGGGAAAPAAGSKLPSFARMPQQSAAAPAPTGRPAAPAAPAPAAQPAAPSAPVPAVQPAAMTAPAPVAQRAVSQTPSAPAQAGASQLPSFARMPQQGAASAAPTAPQPAASQQSVVPAAAAPQAPDAHWGQICQEACAIFRPVIALLNKVTGHFDSDGSLVIVNPGGDFIGKQLQTPNSMNAIKQAAEKVMGHAVAIRVEGAGAAPGRSVRPAAPAAAPAQAASTARPSFGAQPRQSAAASAAAAAASARDAALPAFARMPQQPAAAAQPAAPAASAQNTALPAFARMPQTGQAAPAVASSPAAPVSAPAARDAALPAFARMPQAASTAPAPATGNRPAAPAPQPVAPVDEAPAFEFVPDDMYDGYQDISADVPADGYGAPWDEPAPAEAQPAAPTSAPRPAVPAPAPRPAAPQQPAGFGSSPAVAAPAAPAFAAPAQPADSVPAAQPAFAARPAAPAQPAVPAPAAQPAAPVPGATFGSPAQPAPGEDSTAWLSQLLEAGFGQPVKVTRE
ncbi:MAG: DNA polymerase III subunit gamma/tau [Coriobacteriaceae bacterium]|nr:DNA polymerase III subunit gamma/tau [Coriobacteriaceae bacterium]